MIIEYAGFIIKHWIHVKSTNFLSWLFRNKYPCKNEFVWNVHKQVMLRVIRFSIGLRSKHAWACWDSARAIDFEIPSIHSQMYTFPLLHEFLVNVKCRMDWSYGNPYICLKKSSTSGTNV